MKTILQATRAILFFSVLTGMIYPLIVLSFAHIAFPYQATGSLVIRDGKQVGSSLIAQSFENPRYFWPRPSSAAYARVASGASNKGPTSADLVKSIGERREKFGKNAPVDLLTASGSGLDPHISPASAAYQAQRVATERNLSLEKVMLLVVRHTEGPQLSVLGESRVNILALNLALDREY